MRVEFTVVALRQLGRLEVDLGVVAVAARILDHAVDKFLNSKARHPAKSLPTLAFPPNQPSCRLAELSGIAPKSPTLSPIDPPSAEFARPANPRCPEAFRPLAGWPGGAAPLQPLSEAATPAPPRNS